MAPSAGGVIDETPLGALVATHDLPIYQAGPNAEVVHGLDHSGQRSDQSLPRRVISRTPTESRLAISR